MEAERQSSAIKYKTETITGRKNLKKKTIGDPKKNKAESDSDNELDVPVKGGKVGGRGVA